MNNPMSDCASTDAHAIDEAGWCAAAERMPSPNCDARPDGTAIDLLVLHNISLPPGEFNGAAIGQLFTNTLDCDAHPYFDALRGMRVSAHFLVRRDGSLIQFVATHARAWHAGISCHRGRVRCNDFSIGVELEGCDTMPFEPAQYRSLAALTRALCNAMPLRSVAGHSEIAPGRKTDPGPFFDWDHFLQTAGVELDHADVPVGNSSDSGSLN